jgi:hypothetical protein
VIPPQASAEFVFAMENVLEVYQRRYDPRFPVVCMDETSKQLVSEVRPPIPRRAGQPQRHDYEYERNGVAHLFLAFEPLAGWRCVEVTENRARTDWARFIRSLLEERYPNAERVQLVLDNLNTHSGASFYALCPPKEARHWLERIEIVYTPKHGSWLNMAEGEFSILQRQCLDRRIENQKILQREVKAWQQHRNDAKVGANWQFTTKEARIKLAKLYPSFEE